MWTRSPLLDVSLRRCVFLFLVCALVFSFSQRASTQTAAPSLPITKADLELKDNPFHPGDAAMVLYREVHTDNAKSLETHFTRIKVLTEQGKKYGDIEIPYFEDEIDVENIRARTVAPDGQSTDFGGAVYDKVVAKGRRVRLNVKAFTLPNVQAGSILEYSYSLHWHGGIPDVIKHPENYLLTRGYAFPAARWAVQRELFVRQSHFVLHPFSRNAKVEIRGVHLPKLSPPQQQPDGTFSMNADDIPGVQEEEYSPPEDTMRGEIYIYYVVGWFSNDGYWADLARLEFQQLEKFLSKSKAIQQEVARLIAPTDSPETKVRKLYERVQQIRAISFEPSKTEKEKERQNLKPNKTAEEVLTHNYAFANEINHLFVALVREAGFQAYPVRVVSRNRNFFLRSVPDPGQFDAEVVEVRLPDKTLFLDPATLHCPFGLLPWEETDTEGIRLDQFSTGVVKIPIPSSAEARIERKASFRLDKDGNLAGTLEVNFLGQEALVRRISENNKDDAGRKEDLEEETRKWLPQGATAKLASATGWDGSNGPLHAVFDIQAPGFAAQAGDRLLLPVAVLHSRAEKAFQTSKRENPVYLKYGHQESDEFVLRIPEGYKVESLPRSGGLQTTFSSYKLSADQHGAELNLKRTFVMEGYAFPVAHYPELRNFYEFVRTNDEEQAILQLLPTN